jgi:DNA-binding NarL/FixJ family response regulator
MSRTPTRLPPPPDSPEIRRLIAIVMTERRWTECLSEVALGMWYDLSTPATATWLGKTTSAVDDAERRLFKKLGVHSRTEVALAVDRSLRER